jgi:hypothetical protein
MGVTLLNSAGLWAPYGIVSKELAYADSRYAVFVNDSALSHQLMWPIN